MSGSELAARSPQRVRDVEHELLAPFRWNGGPRRRPTVSNLDRLQNPLTIEHCDLVGHDTRARRIETRSRSAFELLTTDARHERAVRASGALERGVQPGAVFSAREVGVGFVVEDGSARDGGSLRTILRAPWLVAHFARRTGREHETFALRLKA